MKTPRSYREAAHCRSRAAKRRSKAVDRLIRSKSNQEWNQARDWISAWDRLVRKCEQAMRAAA